jgi:hypothetical protein
MRKNAFIVGTLFLVLVLTQCREKKDTSEYVKKSVSQVAHPEREGDILVMGVRHDKEAHCFFDEKSKQQISSAFDSIVQIANGRKIVVVNEDNYFGEEGYSPDSCYPRVFQNLYIIGAETRSLAEKEEFVKLIEFVPSELYRRILVSRFDFSKPVDFHGESARVKATLNIEGVSSNTMNFAERFRQINDSFESKLISIALAEKAKGNFVIVCCGGMHAVSLNQSHGFDFMLTGETVKDENLKMFLSLKIFQALTDMKNKDEINNQKTTN